MSAISAKSSTATASAYQIETPANAPALIVTRTFDAPRALVYECYTKPEHLAHFWGPRETRTVARVDLKVGGVLRFDWRYPDGSGFGYTGVYLELTPPERIVYRDAPEDWQGGFDGLPPAEVHTTLILSESNGRTTVTVTVNFASVAARDEAVRRGFAGMVNVGNDRFAEYLATLPRTA